MPLLPFKRAHDEEDAQVFRPSPVWRAACGVSKFTLKTAIVLTSMAVLYVAIPASWSMAGSSAALRSEALRVDLQAWGLDAADFPKDSFVSSFVAQAMASRLSLQSGPNT